MDSSWPPEFVCPISGSLIVDPVIVASGQTYERRCIEACLQLGMSHCIIYGTPLDPHFIVPNIAAKAAIANLLRARGLRVREPPSVEAAAALAKRLVVVGEELAQESTREGVGVDVEEAERKRGGDYGEEMMARMSLRGENKGGGYGHGYGGGAGRRYPEAQQSLGYGGTGVGARYSHTVGGGGGGGGGGGAPPMALRHSHTASAARYSHSASGLTLREAETAQSPLRPPLLLATQPSSYAASDPETPPSLPLSSLDSLIAALENPTQHDKESAALHLRHLTRSSPQNRLALCLPDLIHALLPLLQSPHPPLQINSAAALVNLSLEKQNKVAIVRSGAIPCLVHLLKHGVPEAQEHAAGAIFSLSLIEENKHSIGVLGAIPPLIQILRSGPPAARPDAALALYHLSLLHSNRAKLVKEGAVPILLNFAQAEDKPDVACRSLFTLSNIAAMPEGRAALIELDAISKLVKLLAVRQKGRKPNRNEAEIPEQAAAVLLLLSKGNLRFKSLAMHGGARELLTELADSGTPRAREKALALLAIMKESPPDPDDPDNSDSDSNLSRHYMKRALARTDGIHMNSSGF